jgi:hypothetical protein
MSAATAIEYLKGLPPDEPVFVLRGQDITAPHFVKEWARLQQSLRHANDEKWQEAYRTAEEMRYWPTRKLPD